MRAKRTSVPATRLPRWALAAALLLSGLLSACVVHPHPVVRHPGPRAEVVVIRAGHVHSHRCGHFLHRGRWYYLRGHLHGHGCGHAHVNGVWRLR